MSDFKLTLGQRLIILTAVLASLLEIIDSSIVNVAIPTMMGNLGTTLEDISWVVTGYIIANAIVLPLSAWLGSRFGRRSYYVTCILIFTGTSVACGFAPNLWTLTVFRVLQGLAGGALLPTSQALIQEQFPSAKAGIASAIYGMSIMIGPTLGPTLGGYLTDNYGWRSIFNINLPLGLLAATLAFTYVKNYSRNLDIPGQTDEEAEALSKQQKAQKKDSAIDAVGLGLLSAGIGCLQFVLERGQADEWFDSAPIAVCTLIAIVCIPTFIWWELRAKNPIINLRLFKESAVANGTILMMMLGFMLYGLVFILPIFMGQVLHYDATQTGMTFIPGALLTAACMPFVGGMLRKTDARYLIFFGIMTIEVCMFMMTNYSSLTGEPQVFNALLVRGLAMAFLFVPINTVVLGQFRGEALGQVAGLMNLFRQIGGSIGIALIGTLLDRNSQQNYLDLVSKVTMLNPNTQGFVQQTEGGLLAKTADRLGLTDAHHATLQSLYGKVQGQVFLMSFAQMLWTIMIIFALSLIPLVLMKVKNKINAPVDAH